MLGADAMRSHGVAMRHGKAIGGHGNVARYCGAVCVLHSSVANYEAVRWGKLVRLRQWRRCAVVPALQSDRLQMQGCCAATSCGEVVGRGKRQKLR